MKNQFIALLASMMFVSVSQAQPSTAARSQTAAASNSWEFAVTPYLWALGINGTVSQDGTELGRFKLSPGNVLSDLKMAAMGVVEARYGRVGLYVDGMYGDLGKSASRTVDQVNLSANTSVKVGMLTVAPSYTILRSEQVLLDGLVGARFMWQNASSTITATEFNESITKSGSVQINAGVVGLKGRFNIGQTDFFVPFYVDVGPTDKSGFTSQAYLGIGRAFGWGDISLVAKNVYYQFKPNSLSTDLNMFGLAVGVTFRF